MKTAKLTGAQLDYWVGRALTGADTRSFRGLELMPVHMTYDIPFDTGPSGDEDGDFFEPSSKWSHGGPLIEREGIWLSKVGPVWRANVGDMGMTYFGETALQAAMRAYVAFKLGEEVPEE
jgi:hypothetical protein